MLCDYFYEYHDGDDGGCESAEQNAMQLFLYPSMFPFLVWSSCSDIFNRNPLQQHHHHLGLADVEKAKVGRVARHPNCAQKKGPLSANEYICYKFHL